MKNKLIITSLIIGILFQRLSSMTVKAVTPNTNTSQTTNFIDAKNLDFELLESFAFHDFENIALEEAWNDYKNVLSNIKIADDYNNNSQGTTAEDFKKMNILNVIPEIIVLGENVQGQIYSYSMDVPFNKDLDNNPGTADIILIFRNNKVVYAGIQNNSFNIKEKNLLKIEKIKQLVSMPFPPRDLEINNPIISSFGSITVNENPYYTISMASGNPANPTIEYFSFKGNLLDYITSKPIPISPAENLENTYLSIHDYIINDSNEFYKLHKPSNDSQTN